MNLLTPLGLLGLIGIIGLILIYILKPNYQQKVISSTYVWKLSLKYKKKKLPISRFRNILLLICQVLILIACAFILTQPYIPSQSDAHQTEKIVIIDASASMLAETDGETRFERAVNQVKTLATDTLKSDSGAITVILADSQPTYIIQRMTFGDLAEINARLDELLDPDDLQCTFGLSDIDGAMELASSMLIENPDSEVLLYTDNSYIDAGTVTVNNVTAKNEWNAAVLDCTATLVENYYTFDITVGCYGRATDIVLHCDFYGVNAERRTVSMRQDVRFDADGEAHVIIGNMPENPIENALYVRPEVAMYSYDNVFIYFENVEDSFDTDNVFRLYGGTKQELKILYCSTNTNPFYSGILMGLRDTLSDYWEVDYHEVQMQSGQSVNPEYCKGYDFYLFEYTMPSSMPTDGVVMLASPDRAPSGLGLTISGSTTRTKEAPLERGVDHPITEYLPLDNFLINEYINVEPSSAFEELLYCNGDPVLLLKDEPATKVVTLLFSVKMTYEAILVDFPLLMGSMFEHFFPATVDKYVYEVGEEIMFKARGTVLQVTADGLDEIYETFPSKLEPLTPGVYTLEQPIMAENFASASRRSVEYIYVKVPSTESNINAVMDTLAQPERIKEPEPVDIDIVFYFAIVLVSLLFAEWLLQIKEQY